MLSLILRGQSSICDAVVKTAVNDVGPHHAAIGVGIMGCIGSCVQNRHVVGVVERGDRAAPIGCCPCNVVDHFLATRAGSPDAGNFDGVMQAESGPAKLSAPRHGGIVRIGRRVGGHGGSFCGQPVVGGAVIKCVVHNIGPNNAAVGIGIVGSVRGREQDRHVDRIVVSDQACMPK